MGNYKELKVWQESVDFVVEIYRISTKFPIEEKFGIISQIRRAAVSIPSNIAEGATAKSTKTFSKFIAIARGSLSEVETQLLISYKLGFIVKEVYTKIIERTEEISRMLAGLQHSLNK